MHIDGGANGHIFTSRKNFLFYQTILITVSQVTGATHNAIGMGLVLFR